MAILKILGIGDLISALTILLLHFEVTSIKITLLISTYLIIKGTSFKNITGMIDLTIGIYIWLIFFGFHTILDYIIIIYLIQKGIASLF